MFFALVVVSNSVYLGVQLEYQAINRNYESGAGFMALHLVYAILFTAEAGSGAVASIIVAIGGFDL